MPTQWASAHELTNMGYDDRGPPRGGGGGGGFGRGPPREMHDATCSDCGKATQVPFKPAEGRPVYCRDCYPKHAKPKKF